VYSKEFITNENGDIVKNDLVKSVGYLLSKKSIGVAEQNCSCFQNKEETEKFFEQVYQEVKYQALSIEELKDRI